MPTEGAKVSGDCLPCNGGYSCKDLGTVTPTSCASGHYCPDSTNTVTVGPGAGAPK